MGDPEHPITTLADLALAQRLAEATLALVNIPSPSWDEQAALEHCAARFDDAGVPYRWAGGHDALLAGHLAAPGAAGRPLVSLAGHLDTVPEQGNLPGRIGEGRVHGLGATDMKGACAVIVELLCDLWPEESQLACAIGGVLFAREELPFGDSALTPLIAAEAELAPSAPELAGGLRITDTALGVVMEPTAGLVQGGCLGNLNVTLQVHGRSAHSARPWQGDNALDKVGVALTHLAGIEPVHHQFAGLGYAECVTATGVRGGVARNVVPGEAEIDINYRYPPGMSPDRAETTLEHHLHGFGDAMVIGHAPSGAVTLDHPLAQRLIELSGAPAEPKQAWTPVAEFTAAGVDAINFGPGDPPLAHQVHESVGIDALAHAHALLSHLIREGAEG
ncbi:MAG: succinyl-diaminopimelate desuccinylase [Solirubrobacteraceae bacterium]|nr:succinyl-diaminopimelate desuccinylase [Solirubrobacteraceae bacterium]